MVKADAKRSVVDRKPDDGRGGDRDPDPEGDPSGLLLRLKRVGELGRAAGLRRFGGRALIRDGEALQDAARDDGRAADADQTPRGSVRPGFGVGVGLIDHEGRLRGRRRGPSDRGWRAWGDRRGARGDRSGAFGQDATFGQRPLQFGLRLGSRALGAGCGRIFRGRRHWFRAPLRGPCAPTTALPLLLLGRFGLAGAPFFLQATEDAACSGDAGVREPNAGVLVEGGAE